MWIALQEAFLSGLRRLVACLGLAMTHQAGAEIMANDGRTRTGSGHL